MTPRAITSGPRSEPEILSIHGSQSVAAAVPLFLGFHPRESVVMLCLTGTVKRLGASLRLGLPVGTSAEGAIARHLVQQATRHATGVVLLCFTDDPNTTLRGRPAYPRTSLIRRCLAELKDHGIPVMDAILVRDDLVWSYLVDDPRAPGRPVTSARDRDLNRLQSSQAAAGRAVLSSRADLVASIAGPVGIAAARASEQIRIAGTRFIAAAVGLDHQQTVALGCSIADQRLTACWTAHLAGAGTTPSLLADLVAVMTHVSIRDVVISWGIQRIADEPLPMVMEIARWTPDDDAGPICLALAIIAYREGDGALANVALDRVLKVEPKNRLAGILVATFSSGVHPSELDRLVLDWSDHPANPAAPIWGSGGVVTPDPGGDADRGIDESGVASHG